MTHQGNQGMQGMQRLVGHAFRMFSAVLALALCATAQAHDGHALNSFMDGFAHPWSGLDHVLAMLAVGLWAMQAQRPLMRWALPLCFVASVTLAAFAGQAGLLPALSNTPLMEAGIVASLLVLGGLIVLRARPPLAPALGLTALMGVFHGLAHGVAMSGVAGAWIYAAGLVLATLALHGLGLFAAHGALRLRQDWILRLAGAGVLGAGLVAVVH